MVRWMGVFCKSGSIKRGVESSKVLSALQAVLKVLKVRQLCFFFDRLKSLSEYATYLTLAYKCIRIDGIDETEYGG